jgi:hypothetical protein
MPFYIKCFSHLSLLVLLKRNLQFLTFNIKFREPIKYFKCLHIKLIKYVTFRDEF